MRNAPSKNSLALTTAEPEKLALISPPLPLTEYCAHPLDALVPSASPGGWPVAVLSRSLVALLKGPAPTVVPHPGDLRVAVPSIVHGAIAVSPRRYGTGCTPWLGLKQAQLGARAATAADRSGPYPACRETLGNGHSAVCRALDIPLLPNGTIS